MQGRDFGGSRLEGGWHDLATSAWLRVTGPGTASLSYWVAPAARGRGVASRSVRLLVEWGWQVGLDRIELYTHVENTGSHRVAEIAGFQFARIEPAAKIVKGRPWDIAWYAIDRPKPSVQRR